MGGLGQKESKGSERARAAGLVSSRSTRAAGAPGQRKCKGKGRARAAEELGPLGGQGQREGIGQ